MATSDKKDSSGFPVLVWEQEDLETRRMPLEELPRQVGIDYALDIIEQRHERIGRAIKLFWGTRDCVEYIQKLVLNGGDGLGKARVGFKPEVVSALLSLINLHQVEPGR